MAHPEVQETRPQHPRGLVLICKVCDKRAPGLPRRLRREVRGLIRDRFAKKGARVLMTSCQDVCPKGAGIVTVVGAGAARTFVVRDPHEGARTAVDALRGGSGAQPTSESGRGADAATVT
jgi:hypothetical protein